MIVPIIKIQEAGTKVDLKDCADKESITIIGISNDGKMLNEWNYRDGLYHYIEHKELYLPKQLSDNMPCEYLIKYDADKPNSIKITCSEKFPSHLKYRAVCTFDISEDGIVIEDIEKGDWISD